MDPWSKEDYSRHIWEALMVVEKLPEINHPSHRVPGQGLLVIWIWGSRRQRNSGENHITEVLPRFIGVRGKYRRKGGTGGSPLDKAARWHGPTLGRATRTPGGRGHPLVPPFGLYLQPVTKTLVRNPTSRFSPLFRRRLASKIGSTRRPLPGTLPEGGLTSGSFSTTMSASGMCRE